MRVLVAGGTGFVGHGIVPALLAAGHEVTVLSRDPDRVAKEWPSVGTVSLDLGAGTDALTEAAKGHDAVVNLVGIIRAKWWAGDDFDTVLRGGLSLVEAAERAGASRLVYLSANGVRPGGTAYQATKARIEARLQASDLKWTVLRPSIVFGEGSEFLRTFGRLTALRVVPYFGSGEYTLQPVSREDVASVVVAALAGRADRRVLHLGGPRVYTFKEFLRLVGRAKGRRILLVPVPRPIIGLAAALLSWVPGFPATPEQLRMLYEGNQVPEQEWLQVVGGREPSALEAFLGIEPKEGVAWTSAAAETTPWMPAE